MFGTHLIPDYKRGQHWLTCTSRRFFIGCRFTKKTRLRPNVGEWPQPLLKRFKEVIWTHYQKSVSFLPPWLLHILQGSRVEDPRQLWLKGWYEEEERQNRTSATAWTVEQRVQAQTAARHPSQASILAAGASQLFNLGLLSRSSQDRTKETSTRHLQFMWYFFSLISSDRERGCAVLQYSLLFNIVVH